MAQTGDVKHGNTKNSFNPGMVGTGGSDLPDLKAEFNDIPHERGILSWLDHKSRQCEQSILYLFRYSSTLRSSIYSFWQGNFWNGIC